MRKSELFIRLVTSASVMMYGFDLSGSAYAVFLADKLFIVKDKSSIDSFLSWSLAYPLLIAADGMAFDTRLVNYVKKKGGFVYFAYNTDLGAYENHVARNQICIHTETSAEWGKMLQIQHKVAKEEMYFLLEAECIRCHGLKKLEGIPLFLLYFVLNDNLICIIATAEVVANTSAIVYPLKKIPFMIENGIVCDINVRNLVEQVGFVRFYQAVPGTEIYIGGVLYDEMLALI
jgi:hypothetical protein